MFNQLLLLLVFHSINIIYGQYDVTQANIGVWLSGAAYCEKDIYTTMVLDGPATGFIVTNVLYDLKTDLQGFIGYMESTKSIHVVFRGSSSLLNWLDNLQIKQVPYTTWTECNCNVHNGFYKATLNLRNETIRFVNLLRIKFPRYNIIVNGHSLGAIISQMISMEMLKENIVSTIYNYGQPRGGDLSYANFVNTKITNYFRHTHNKDIVPHIPPMNKMEYYHSCQEIFENEYGDIKFCSSNECEDNTCCDQYLIKETNVDDHLYYLAHRVSCEESII